VRPDLTGRGQGSRYVDAVLTFARRTFAVQTFRVTVAEFNQRAQKVWEKAGFQHSQTFGRGDGKTFMVLVLEP